MSHVGDVVRILIVISILGLLWACKSHKRVVENREHKEFREEMVDTVISEVKARQYAADSTVESTDAVVVRRGDSLFVSVRRTAFRGSEVRGVARSTTEGVQVKTEESETVEKDVDRWYAPKAFAVAIIAIVFLYVIFLNKKG